MIPNHLPATWTALAPALGNHLWQSTLFAMAAGLLTLILRKNQARARYGLWLAASLKFLIPFSLLASLGSHLAWLRDSAGTKAGLYFAMEEASQPFTSPTMSVISRATPSTVSSSLIQLVPALLAVVWLSGFLVVLFVWLVRWRRISAAVRDAEPLREGREVETLRRLERIGGRRKRIEMFLSRASLEPGIFGIARPVLVWPEGISQRLEDAHLEAILAHEVWHVRRRDNLAAALHMLVEAIFWFHPLVWWLGARLMEERERACDEAVLESGSDRQVYAESILKICEFCVGSPLACVPGVTGADLKKRISRIMTERVARKLDFSRRLLLSAAGLVAVTVPLVFGLLHATQIRAESQAQSTAAIAPTFEGTSIKPNKNGEPMAGFSIIGRPAVAIMWKADRFVATNFSLHMLILRAYDVQDDQISGGPSWLDSEKYDVEAKMDKSAADQLGKLSPDQYNRERQRMLQELLADRFKLSLHHETKELPGYALVIAKNGVKLHEAKPGDTYPNGMKCLGGRPCGAGGLMEPERNKLVGQGVPIAPLVRELSQKLGGRIVVDKTGMTGNYDFTLQWKPDETTAAILRATQEQLGLKLESETVPMDVLVIDRAENPADPQAQNTAVIPPVFAVASVKPGRGGAGVISERLLGNPDGFTATNFTLQTLIATAYGVGDDQISGAPNWLNSERFDIEAKIDKSVLDALQELSEDQRLLQRKHLLQEFLGDRFSLTLHRETQHLPVYELVIAQSGPKLQEAKPGDTYPNGFKGPDGRVGTGMMRFGVGELTGQGVPVALLVRELSRELSRGLGGSIIEDRTGLKGNYDFTLRWTAGVSQTPAGGQQVAGGTPSRDSSGPSLFTAIQEQLGLKLESQNGPGEILVIDHVEKPSAK